MGDNVSLNPRFDGAFLIQQRLLALEPLREVLIPDLMGLF